MLMWTSSGGDFINSTVYGRPMLTSSGAGLTHSTVYSRLVLTSGGAGLTSLNGEQQTSILFT